eukprot:EG_transcript_4206
MVSSVTTDDICDLTGTTISFGSSQTGTLSRLNFPSGDNCQVTLHLTGSGYLSTNFEMDFEPGYGTLSFYDGPTTSGNFLGSWNSPALQVAACQALTPFLTVVWTSNTRTTRSGWTLVYRSDPDFCDLSGTTVSAPTLSVGAYRHVPSVANERCIVTFYSNTPSYIYFYVTVPSGGTVTFYDGVDTTATVLPAGNPVTSTGQSLTVLWTTGANIPSNWAFIFYAVQDICLLTGSTIVALSEPALLLHQSGTPISCSVVLQAVGDYVSSRFVQLDAPSQTVDLYDGPTSSSTLLGSFSGALGFAVAVTVNSTGPPLTVAWSSTSGGSGSWGLKYVSISRTSNAAGPDPPVIPVNPQPQPLPPPSSAPAPDNGWWIGLSAGLAGGFVGLVLLAPIVVMAYQHFIAAPAVQPREIYPLPVNMEPYPYPMAPVPTPHTPLAYFDGVAVPEPLPWKPL